MAVFKATTALVAVLMCCVAATAAGFSSLSSNNLAVYWGQNSYQQPTGQAYSQERLSYYCSNTNINIIPLAFLHSISAASVNFANADDNCTAFARTTLLSCPQLEEDIQTCQSTYGKTILLSIGGATYTEGGFSSASAATAAADNIWAMFGPVRSGSSVNRPFGNAVIDGFDMDFESGTSNMASFASELRSKMIAATAAGGKAYYLSAAPQCPYPDVADNDMLDGAVYFDFIMIQFYNNDCGLQSFVSGSAAQNNFDYSTWDNWAKTVSKNPNVRILLGIPGSSTAAGSGFVNNDDIEDVSIDQGRYHLSVKAHTRDNNKCNNSNHYKYEHSQNHDRDFQDLSRHNEDSSWNRKDNRDYQFYNHHSDWDSQNYNSCDNYGWNNQNYNRHNNHNWHNQSYD